MLLLKFFPHSRAFKVQLARKGSGRLSLSFSWTEPVRKRAHLPKGKTCHQFWDSSLAYVGCLIQFWHPWGNALWSPAVLPSPAEFLGNTGEELSPERAAWDPHNNRLLQQQPPLFKIVSFNRLHWDPGLLFLRKRGKKSAQSLRWKWGANIPKEWFWCAWKL